MLSKDNVGKRVKVLNHIDSYMHPDDYGYAVLDYIEDDDDGIPYKINFFDENGDYVDFDWFAENDFVIEEMDKPKIKLDDIQNALFFVNDLDEAILLREELESLGFKRYSDDWGAFSFSYITVDHDGDIIRVYTPDGRHKGKKFINKSDFFEGKVTLISQEEAIAEDIYKGRQEVVEEAKKEKAVSSASKLVISVIQDQINEIMDEIDYRKRAINELANEQRAAKADIKEYQRMIDLIRNNQK